MRTENDKILERRSSELTISKIIPSDIKLPNKQIERLKLSNRSSHAKTSSFMINEI
jgi:hypothetical protein